MIEGYADESSVWPGDIITFRVPSPDSLQFRIDFYRQGVTLDFQLSTEWFPAVDAPGRTNGEDWSDSSSGNAWPAYPVQTPSDWRTGAYIAMFVEGDGNGNPNPNQRPPIDASTADARSGKSLFVVKNPTPGTASQVLFKIPLFTYTAYNPKGGSSVYQGGDVSLHRPGNGTGGTPWDTFNIDVFDGGSHRQTFVHWEAKLISWLESQGYRVDYCTDLDIHNDTDLALLSPYALTLSSGHDEYYTHAMRDHLEAYVANGGNIAFFSGNTSWWRVTFRSDPPLIFNRGPNWIEIRPEYSLTGVSYYQAGERDFPTAQDKNERVGFTVQHTELWPFENTGLNDGDTFGRDECLVGYECDGVPFDKNSPRPVSPSQDPQDYAPKMGQVFSIVDLPRGFTILGTGDCSVWPNNAARNYAGSNLIATMGMYTNSGTVFTAATTDWPRVVSQAEPNTTQITRNVMNRLGGNPKGLAQLANLANVTCCDGFYSGDDQYRHAIVGTSDGAITEIFFSPQTGIGQVQIARLDGLVDVGAFYSDDDQYRHVIAVTGDGNIWEVYYNPDVGVQQTVIGDIPNAIRVCGFFSGDDNYRHAGVMTRDGRIFEIFYHPAFGIFQGELPQGGIIDITGFYSSDDQFRHVLTASLDGNITETYFKPAFGIQQTVIANVPGVQRISAYYAAGDDYFNRRVQVLTQSGRIHEIRYNPKFGIMRTVLFNTAGLTDIGAFHSTDDGFRHSILAPPTGDIQELFFKP